MNRNEFDQKFPKGTYVASLNAKLGTVVARSVQYITRARDFSEERIEFRALMFSAEQLLGYAQKMKEEMESLLAGPPSATIVVTSEQQEVLDAVEDCIAENVELPEELWQKFWDMFGSEIESKYGSPEPKPLIDALQFIGSVRPPRK